MNFVDRLGRPGLRIAQQPPAAAEVIGHDGPAWRERRGCQPVQLPLDPEHPRLGFTGVVAYPNDIVTVRHRLRKPQPLIHPQLLPLAFQYPAHLDIRNERYETRIIR